MKRLVGFLLISLYAMPQAHAALSSRASGLLDEIEKQKPILNNYCKDGLGTINCTVSSNGRSTGTLGCTCGPVENLDRDAMNRDLSEFCTASAQKKLAERNGSNNNQTAQQNAQSDTTKKTDTAATISISGTVLDAKNNKPLTGASVIVPDTTTGVAVDYSGKFTLNVPANTTTIEISFVGYKKQSLTPTANMGTIRLEREESELDEVVVNGGGITDGASCSSKNYGKEAEDTRTPNEHATTEKYVAYTDNGVKKFKCVPTACVHGYKVEGANTINAKCVAINCEGPRYVLNAAGTSCEDKNGKTCTPDGTPDATAESYIYKYDASSNKLNCVISKCKDKNYLPNADGTKCEQSQGPCSAEQIAAIPNATAGNLKNKVCYPTECARGYKPSGTECVGTPTLSEEDEQNRLNDLRKNADDMKAKEQSLANRLVGAASIGMTGIGAMQAATALAEKNADDMAERDMAAYLETFRCDFGQGKNIRGGDRDIELPGGNDLFDLYLEYGALAENLKLRKDALGLRPGIEAEVVISKADTGLYDNESLGKTTGSYTSVARALMDPNGEDAKAWEKQKSDAAKKLKTGALVAAGGVAVGVLGNVLANIGQPKESSAKILTEYEGKKRMPTTDEDSADPNTTDPQDTGNPTPPMGGVQNPTTTDTDAAADTAAGATEMSATERVNKDAMAASITLTDTQKARLAKFVDACNKTENTSLDSKKETSTDGTYLVYSCNLNRAANNDYCFTLDSFANYNRTKQACDVKEKDTKNTTPATPSAGASNVAKSANRTDITPTPTGYYAACDDVNIPDTVDAECDSYFSDWSRFFTPSDLDLRSSATAAFIDIVEKYSRDSNKDNNIICSRTIIQSNYNDSSNGISCPQRYIQCANQSTKTYYEYDIDFCNNDHISNDSKHTETLVDEIAQIIADEKMYCSFESIYDYRDDDTEYLFCEGEDYTLSQSVCTNLNKTLNKFNITATYWAGHKDEDGDWDSSQGCIITTFNK